MNLPASNERLWELFVKRWCLNQNGGFAARLARWRIWHYLAVQKLGLHRWVKARLFCEQEMWVLTGETISSALLGFGYSESALTALMLKTVKPGMRFVDIGAHLGYEALLASVLVGASGTVVSFEPQPRIGAWTLRNLDRFQQTRLIPSALGETEGTLRFSEMDLMDSGFSGSTANITARQISVPVTSLNQALRPEERPVDFIKCDVEGGEMEVLRGAVDILKSDRPILVLEAEMPSESPQRPRVKQFDNFLSPLGYRGLSFDFDGELKLAPFGALREGHANVAFVPSSRTDLLPPISS